MKTNVTETNGPEPALNEALLQQYAKRKTGLLERLVRAYLDEAPQFHQNIREGGSKGVKFFNLRHNNPVRRKPVLLPTPKRGPTPRPV